MSFTFDPGSTINPENWQNNGLLANHADDDYTDSEEEAENARQRQQEIDEGMEKEFGKFLDDDSDDEEDNSIIEDKSVASDLGRSEQLNGSIRTLNVFPNYSGLSHASGDSENGNRAARSLFEHTSGSSLSRDSKNNSHEIQSHAASGSLGNACSNDQCSGYFRTDNSNSQHLPECNGDQNGSIFSMCNGDPRKHSTDENQITKSGYSTKGSTYDSGNSESYIINLRAQVGQLQIKYDTCHQQLMKEKKMREKSRTEYKEDIQTRSSQYVLLEAEKDELSKNLLESNNIVQDLQRQNNLLRAELNAVTVQISSLNNEREEIIAKIAGKDISIQALENKISELSRMGSREHLMMQHENIVQDLKLRHQKEMQSLREECDEFQRNLNFKTTESDAHLQARNQLQIKYEECRKKYADLLSERTPGDSGHNSQKLESQVQYLEDAKNMLEDENCNLKKRIRDLEKAENLRNGRDSSKLLKSGSKEELVSKLEQTVKMLSAEKQETARQIEERDEQLHECLRKIKKLEVELSQIKESYDESKKNTRKNSSDKSKAIDSYKSTIEHLETELNKLKSDHFSILKDLGQAEAEVQVLTSNKQRLEKAVESSDEEHKVQNKKCQLELESHYKKVLKEYQQKSSLQSNAMRNELKMKNQKLYENKKEFSELYEENKSLEARIKDLSVPKERLELEKDIRQQCEEKLNRKLETFKAQYLEETGSKLDTLQKEWIQKRTGEMQSYVEDLKRNLDQKFHRCLEQERSKVESERDFLREKYQSTIQELTEKISGDVRNENMTKLRALENEHENKLMDLQKEIRKLKNELSFQDEELRSSLQKQMQNQQAKLEQKLKEAESSTSYLNNEVATLTKQADLHKEKIKQEEKKFSSLQDKYTGVKSQMSILQKLHDEKQRHWLSIKSKYEQDILELNEKCSRQVLPGIHLNSAVQTEEEMVSKQNMRCLFVENLNKISDVINRHLASSSRKRLAFESSLHQMSNTSCSCQRTGQSSCQKHSRQTFAKTIASEAQNISPSFDFRTSKIQTSTPELRFAGINFLGAQNQKHKCGDEFCLQDTAHIPLKPIPDISPNFLPAGCILVNGNQRKNSPPQCQCFHSVYINSSSDPNLS